MKKFINIDGAKPSSLPLSLAVEYEKLLFISGMTSRDLHTNEPISGTIEEETAIVLGNILKILEAAGSKPEQIIKTTVFLSDMKFFDGMNKVFNRFFNAESKAARSTVGVDLVGNCKVEIEVIAYV